MDDQTVVLRDFLERQALDPNLYDDRRDPARPGPGTAYEVASLLRIARSATSRLHEVLVGAAELSSHLGNDTIGS